MRLLHSLTTALVLCAHVVRAETITVPPVVITALTHQHAFDSGLQQTITSDTVLFPCAPADCSGPGFSASIGAGDTVVIRFAAPTGQRFDVTRAPGGTQYFDAWAFWHTGTSDVTSNFPTGTITFENLTGTAPANYYSLNAVSDNGQAVTSVHQFTVSGDFSFTALRIEFVVGHALADVLRTYNAVNSSAAPSFGSTRVVNGTSSDATVMALVSNGVVVPPVVISTLAHEHFVETTSPLQMITRDAVQFPCSAGNCNGPGFSASIGQGDTVVLRYTAPTGYKFVVTRAPGGNQFFLVNSRWITGTPDVSSHLTTLGTVTFENLSGTAPTSFFNRAYLSDNGEAISVDQQYTVSGDFSFTAMTVETTVGHTLAAQLRAYGAVDSTTVPAFSSSRVVSGPATDAIVMSIEPIAASQAFCFADGNDTSHTTACPCGNSGAAGNGCANSVNPAGANLSATGAANPDTIALHGSGMPATVVCIYIQQDARGDSVFGDGVSCAAGNLIRLRAKTNVGGASQFPDGTDTITVSQRGGVTPGSGVLRYYASYYRNAAAPFCPPLTYNITNGWIVRW